MKPQPERLAVLSYSARSLVQAATELGFRKDQVLALDAFADQETRAASSCWVVENWGSDAAATFIARTVEGFFEHTTKNARTVVLGGGTENWPELLSQLERVSKPLSPTPTTMRDLRSWRKWEEWARNSGILFPKTFDSPPSNTHVELLRKSHQGAGGLGVSRNTWANQHSAPAAYYQEFLEGRTIGINLAITEDDSRILGAYESLGCEFTFGPKEFIYRGSKGPLVTNVELASKLMHLGNQISRGTKYKGLIGIDILETQNGDSYLLEMNPRWTASMELLSATTHFFPLAEHFSAHEFQTTPPVKHAGSRFATKVIYYAKINGEIDHANVNTILAFAERASRSNAECRLLDVPGALPHSFEKGEPVFSIVAHGDSLEQTDEAVQSLLSNSDQVLGVSAAKNEH